MIDHDRSLSKSIPPLWINWVSTILHHLHQLSPCWFQVFATWPCHASQIVGDLPQSRQLVLRLLSLQTGLGRYGTIIIVVGLIGWPWLFPKYLFSICFLLVCWILLILVAGHPRVGMCWFGSPLSSLQMMTALATLLLLDLEMVESNCIQLHHHTSTFLHVNVCGFLQMFFSSSALGNLMFSLISRQPSSFRFHEPGRNM